MQGTWERQEVWESTQGKGSRVLTKPGLTTCACCKDRALSLTVPENLLPHAEQVPEQHGAQGPGPAHRQTRFSGSAPCAVKPKPILMGTPKDITNKCRHAAKQQLSTLLSCSGKQQLLCNWKDRFSSLSAKAANSFFLEHTQHNIPLGQTRIQQPNQTQPLPEHSESVQVPAQQKQTIENKGKNRNDLQGSSCCSSL